jgi:hypothetical protein
MSLFVVDVHFEKSFLTSLIDEIQLRVLHLLCSQIGCPRETSDEAGNLIAVVLNLVLELVAELVKGDLPLSTLLIEEEDQVRN